MRYWRGSSVLVGILGWLLISGVWAGAQMEEPVLASETDYEAVAGLISRDEIAQTIEHLAAADSRVTGYPGYKLAARLVERRFRELDLEEVSVEEFTTLVPWSDPARGPAATLATSDGREQEILPLWPNLVRCPKTPPGGLTGKLIYAGNGELRSFNGLEVINSIVMVDFNCGNRWFNALLLGAQAVLFIEPNTTLRGEAEEKFLSMPVNIPRFWVPKETADYLLARLTANPDTQVTVKCEMEWKKVTARNITGRIQGTDPRLSKQQVVVQAYYDSISITPTQAPGAENAASIAALFQLIKAFKQHPPKRSVVFLATAGHFQGLAGAKNFVRKRIRGARSDTHVKRLFNVSREAREGIESVTRRLWTEPMGQYHIKRQPRPLDEQLRGLQPLLGKVNVAAEKADLLDRIVEYARRTDPNAGKLVAYQLTEEEIADRKRLVDKFDDRVPQIKQAATKVQSAIKQAQGLSPDASDQQKNAVLEKTREVLNDLTAALDFSEENIYLWFSVDLSSHNDTLGLFYKAYYYDYSEEDQWRFSAIGKKAREYAELIGRELSISAQEPFVDGINAFFACV